MASVKASSAASAASVCSCSSSGAAMAWRPVARGMQQQQRRMRLAPLRASIPNEADALYKGIPLASGLINKRLMQKQMSKENKEFMSAMKLAEDDARKETLFRRESRTPATNDEELVEYFLNTLAEDMEFEVARNRPRLSASFFLHLDKVIGQVRFGGEPDEDRLLELEALRQYLTAAVEVVDQTVAKTSSAKERVAKLLQSKDKKATILDMAENNEIDQALMDLLQQNIQAARMAGQEEPAKFMEKVMQACAKFFVAVPAAGALPAAPVAGAATAAAINGAITVTPGAAGQGAAAPDMGSGSGLIIPGAAPPRAPRAANMGVPVAPKPLGGSDGGSSLILPGR